MNLEFGSQRFEGVIAKAIHGSYLPYFLFIKFCLIVLSSARKSLWKFARRVVVPVFPVFGMSVHPALYSTSFPSLIAHIVNVVGGCSKKQMGRIHTGRIIAFMQNAKSFWNFPVMNLKRSSVATGVHTVFGSSVIKEAVTFLCFPFCPNPARSKFRRVWLNRPVFVNLAPKPLNVFRCHIEKTPANSEVKSAQWSGNVIDGCKFWVSLVFSATSRPQSTYYIYA